MSSLYMYEFEDKLWDEFCRADDHIVPIPGFECAGDNSIRGGICKRASEKGEYSTPSKRQKKMLDKDSLSNNETIILGDKSVANDNHTGHSFDSFEKEDKYSSDFLHYDWPEIGNFEDFDEMCRSCDSTFGLGASEEDHLDWFSSENVQNLDFTFPCPESSTVTNISENNESSKSLTEDKFENHIDAERSELGSSIVQGSSAIDSGDISLEVATLDQLQLVMEWMDLRTKLRIRDGLYRLARSAEQRLHANLSGDSHEENSNRLLMAEEAIKCGNFKDMETNTNPIDRSIAQLLFHRS